MAKQVIFICDVCGIETRSAAIEKVPVIKERWIKGGIGDLKLMPLGHYLEFEDIEMCSSCEKTYRQCWTDAMVRLVNDWLEAKKTINLKR